MARHAALAFARPQKRGTTMEADKLFDDYLAAWNAHDAERILGFFVDDCVYEDVPMSRVNKGKDEIRAFLDESFATFPDFHLEKDSEPALSADGSFGMAWVMSGTHEGDAPGMPATHKSFTVRGASIGVLDGDK